MNNLLRIRLPLFAAAILGLYGVAAQAQLVIKDTLTGASSSYDWFLPGTISNNGACLTAGDGTGKIPKCVGKPIYSGKTLVGGTSGRLPDAVGYGALRLSNGDTTTGNNGNNQTGSIVSNFTFPTNEGIQVTWTSVSYGGNNYNGTGADGIAFFLSDGTQTPTIGAFGGSLGYSCANGKNPSDGVIGGYLGVGIDEFGNFSNPGDNTNTGPGFHAGRIGVRGAGSTAWSWLQGSALYSKYYTGSTANATAVQKTCSSGYAWNYSGVNQTDSTGVSIPTGNQTHDKLAFNYPLLYSLDVPPGVSLANQQAIATPLRGNAVPIIFSLKITADGLLDFSYSVNNGATQTVASGFNIIASNGPLPASFRFGFSSGTGGGSNVHEITCFSAQPANLSNTSAGSNVQGQPVSGGTQVFLAFYHPVNWWGSVTASSLIYNSATDSLNASPIANWDGNCVLTGGACSSMTASTATTSVNVPVQAPSDRAVVSWNNGTLTTGAGIAFKTYTSLPSAEQSSIGSQAEVDYLRGVRTMEASNLATGTAGALRNRTSVLGDIVDSSPEWVGPPAFNYANAWVDQLYASTMPEGTSYATFVSSNASRMAVVYVGSNDGMMHAFRAGTLSSDGSTLSNNDGRELLAYIPGQVISAIHPASTPSLDYSSTQYQHNFQVDATPGMGDLYYGGNWHTWLVSGLGAGGHPGGAVNSNTATIAAPVSALFALDITDPKTFSESNAAALVIGEWSSATISCVGNTTCGTNFGQTLGTPLIRRLHDGSWGVIWGNGLNSASGRAGIFIMHVSTLGLRTFQYIDAGQGPGNGIVAVAAVDLDGDHVSDFVYGGDALGNVWRFDLHSNTSTDWNTAVTKLFTTATGQPITTTPVISAIPAGNTSGNPKLLVSFGTGQKLPLTAANAEIYAGGTQSLYGIWDANMSTWNATASNTKYDVLPASGSSALVQPVPISTLTVQTVMSSTTGDSGLVYRKLSQNPVCWNGSSVCLTGNTSLGWKLDLPGTGEQVIYNPTQIDDSFVVNTTIPQSLQPLTCGTTLATGFTMAPDIKNGSGDNAPLTTTTTTTTTTNNGTTSTTTTTTQASGVGDNGVGTWNKVSTGTGASNSPFVGGGKGDGTSGWLKWSIVGGTVTPVTWTKLR